MKDKIFAVIDTNRQGVALCLGSEYDGGCHQDD